jgi:predicted DNA-binding ribbon-helix-helix protein
MSQQTKILPIKLTEKDLRTLQDVARDENMNTSQLVRSLVAKYVRERNREFTSDKFTHGRPRATA